MYLSRVYLNPQSRGAKKLLGSPQAMHAAVLSSFPPDATLSSDQGRVLWRVDGAGTPRVALYTVSPEEPDFTALCEQGGWPTRPEWRTSSLKPLVDSLAEGQEFGFRLTANPTRTAPTSDKGERGKIYGHVTPEQQVDWLVERAERGGFSVRQEESDGPSVRVINTTMRQFRRERGTVTLRVTTYEGVLKVTDPERLRGVLGHGIGRSRAYGCGLMTLVR